jgi:antitoxin component YwqK of YwqJK toxin-antitoxin module
MNEIKKLFIGVCVLCLFAACGNNKQSESTKQIKMHELEDKGGLAYLPEADKPFTGTAYSYFPDGTTIFTKSDFAEGKQNGEYVEYFQNGQINYKYSFKNGIEDGEWVWYNEEGNLLKKAIYKDGELNGEWITYHSNGQINVKGQFENGEEIGEWFQWDAEGNPMER